MAQSQQVLSQEHLSYLAEIPSVAAEVIDIGSANFEQSIEINCGSSSGVTVGQPVVSAGGLIGSDHVCFHPFGDGHPARRPELHRGRAGGEQRDSRCGGRGGPGQPAPGGERRTSVPTSSGAMPWLRVGSRASASLRGYPSAPWPRSSPRRAASSSSLAAKPVRRPVQPAVRASPALVAANGLSTCVFAPSAEWCRR